MVEIVELQRELDALQDRVSALRRHL